MNPAAVLPILFEPFTRPAPDSAGVRTQGLGLGLYIASEIVHAHGATISVTSTAGQGTTFTIPMAAKRASSRMSRRQSGGANCSYYLTSP